MPDLDTLTRLVALPRVSVPSLGDPRDGSTPSSLRHDSCFRGPWNGSLWRWHHKPGDREGVWLPDPTDPATVGCLLTLAREAWGDPGLAAYGGYSHETGVTWRTVGGKPHGGTFARLSERHHATEADALIAAIIAADAVLAKPTSTQDKP